MVKVEISTAIWYCGLWQFYVCKEHLKSRPGSVTYRYQQKTKKTKIKMVFFNTLLLIFVDVGWVASHIIAITPEKWWNQYRRKISRSHHCDLNFFVSWNRLFPFSPFFIGNSKNSSNCRLLWPLIQNQTKTIKYQIPCCTIYHMIFETARCMRFKLQPRCTRFITPAHFAVGEHGGANNRS